MFYSQFLCLLYLMTLANSYTISKTTNHLENSDNIIDTINDEDSSLKNFKYKMHKNRREEASISQFTTISDSKSAKPHKTIKRKKVGFWKKIKNKYKTTIGPVNDHGSLNLVYSLKDFKKETSNSLKGKTVSQECNIGKRRFRQAKIEVQAFLESEKKKNMVNNETDLKPCQHYIQDVVRNLTGNKFIKTDYNDNALEKLIAKMTGKITEPSALDGANQGNSAVNSVKVESVDTTPVIIENKDKNELGTVQIETLLNEIKERAIQMVSEINPTFSDVIVNAVTETTFAADPFLKGIAVSKPAFAHSSNLKPSDDYKRAFNYVAQTANETEVDNWPSHKIDLRSLKEDGMTVAHTIEDYLQKELKHIYNKVKNKVEKDFQKEIKTVKSTIKKKTSQITKKISTCPTKAMSKSTKTPKKKTPVIRSNRGNVAKTKKPTTTLSSSTVDDFILLTLYEQILAKTHGDNIMKMVTMPSLQYMKRKDENLISKRNSETLSDLKLKDYIRKIYDDGVMVPDTYVYGSDIDVSDVSSPSNDYSEEIKEQASTEQLASDTSYEGLTNKISYNDYVNGYKYYLKYQKDEANSNFSNLVKYQAHRHHNVDDIGKYILNKIPQVTTTSKREKRAKNKIFDDTDFEDQEVSTKTDDSWFRKHFYMFIDNGPPKKFHSSQTVSFKSITGEEGAETDTLSTNKKERDVEYVNEEEKSKGESAMTLDELSKDLETKFATVPNIAGSTPPSKHSDTVPNPKGSEISLHNLPILKDIHMNLEKFFGKGTRTPYTTDKKGLKYDNYDEIKSSDDIEQINKIEEDINDPETSEYFKNVNRNEFSFNRSKRNPKKHVKLHDNIKGFKKWSISTTNSNITTRNNKKYGCVNIDLVPTQIVTLRDKKESKFKRIFNIFHKDKNKAHKREIQRVQRFNPLKKIKDIFGIKADEKVINTATNELDYEMLTSKIPAFKHYKFDRVHLLEEIKKQIPNITDEFKGKHKVNEIFNNFYTIKDENNENDITFTEMNKYDNFLDTLDSQFSSTMKTKEETDFDIPKVTLPTTTPKQKSTFPVNDYKYTEYALKDNFDSHNDFENITASFFPTETSNATYEELKNKLDKLQIKVTLNNKDDRTYLKTLIEKDPKMYGMKETKDNSEKLEDKGITLSSKQSNLFKYHFKPNQKDETIDITPVLESPRLYENIYETQSVPKASNKEKIKTDEGRIEDLNYFINNIESSKGTDKNITRNTILYKNGFHNVINVTPRQSETTAESFNEAKSFKPYPDYFNDLLMWNHDILNDDRVTSWNNLIKTDISLGYTTLGAKDLRKELKEIEERLSSYKLNGNREKVHNVIAKSSVTPAVKIESVPKVTKNGIVRKVPDNNDASGLSNEILIKGESKYFRYDKHPVEVSEQIVKTIDLVKRINSDYDRNDLPKKIARGDDDDSVVGPTPRNVEIVSVDSTLLSYDDDIDFVTVSLAPKILSKNSLKTFEIPHKSNLKAVKPVTKINSVPKQYFATPLPMSMNMFEKFLRDNNLDVASVTSPVFELPLLPANDRLDDKHEGHTTTENNKKKNNTAAALEKEYKMLNSKKNPHKVNQTRVVSDKLMTVNDTYNELDDKSKSNNEKQKNFRSNDVQSDLEDLYRLHRELFTENENNKFKRDTASKSNNVDADLDRYINNIKIFDSD